MCTPSGREARRTFPQASPPSSYAFVSKLATSSTELELDASDTVETSLEEDAQWDDAPTGWAAFTSSAKIGSCPTPGAPPGAAREAACVSWHVKKPIAAPYVSIHKVRKAPASDYKKAQRHNDPTNIGSAQSSFGVGRKERKERKEKSRPGGQGGAMSKTRGDTREQFLLWTELTARLFLFARRTWWRRAVQLGGEHDSFLPSLELQEGKQHARSAVPWTAG